LQPPKPRAERIQTEITRLPTLTKGRRVARFLIQLLAKILVKLCLKLEIVGLENIPREGPILTVSNHLGDADFVVGMACTPRLVDAIAKTELYYIPVLGKLMDLYGVIWIHRGQPDRRAIRAALQALEEGRNVIIAPEGRESLTGSLEEGTQGAAYIAWKANVPIQPATITGTENSRIYNNLKRLRRTKVTLTIGKTFILTPETDRTKAIQNGTDRIMQALASQLPKEYQGAYAGKVEAENGSGHP
jgi:1-acyl-sn-glycerol-3-phosphate acyltransferase